jgi:hypothetical protein
MQEMNCSAIVKYLFRPEDTTASTHRAGIYFFQPTDNPPWGYVKNALWIVLSVLIGRILSTLD